RLSGGRSAERIRALAQQARYLAARDETAEALYLDEALTEWSGLANQPWEQIGLAPTLAEALGTERAYRLLPRLRELLHHTERLQQDDMRGDWRLNLSWALACLGEWPLAFAVAHAIAQPRQRIEALQWLAWYAPLSAWRGHLRVLLEDEPTRVFCHRPLAAGTGKALAKRSAASHAAPYQNDRESATNAEQSHVMEGVSCGGQVGEEAVMSKTGGACAFRDAKPAVASV
ncbi:MAG: hypothetical protein HC808_17340, partial [Candidatus Competibacteraceae bacterium]|nr:hypothetical protein [Candidatus Competibacteraceae bacterium]